jgi:hypothetical protein
MFEAIRPEEPALADERAGLSRPDVVPGSTARVIHVWTGPAAHIFRAERQCLMRLPETRAVVFSIHTYVVHLDDLEPAAREGLAEARL